MNNIKVMSTSLANKIAAGEVVLNPASVVKELIENAIDAKSTNIKIELEESGTKSIKITDNGNGMSKEDARLCFLRHATSKLINEEDLFSINTLGFRGEALPSIAAVSKVTLKTGQGKDSITLELKNGEIIKEENTDAKKGTTITIKNLFYNTPARLKYLKSLPFELSLITSLVNKTALAYPNITFTLTNNKNDITKTSGSNNLLKTINEIYGLEVTKNMLEINGENNDYKINGYISKPEITRSNRNHINIMVNNRNIKSPELNKIISEGYHTYKPENRHPIIVLNIEVDTTLVDVNIHPAKQNVKFSKLDELETLILKSIKNTLEPQNLIPNVKIEEKIIEPINNIIQETLDFNNLTPKEEIKNMVMEEETIYNEPEAIKKLPNLEPVGIVSGTYIIYQNEKGMYLIDQHAAKERINYEKYLTELGKEKNDTIDMLIPLTIQYPKEDYIILNEKKEELKNIGINFEEFGINTIIIKSHPTWFIKGYETESIKKIIDLILEEKNFSKEKFNESIAITLSCKLSIKANTYTDIKSMENLANDLRQTKNPYTCPHGRPTVIFYSQYELEKLFKRAI